jgi:hypothetical protein
MIDKALVSLCPNASFVINGETYEDIFWHENNEESLPSKEEVESEIQRLQAEYDAKEYQRLRAKEYPSFADQFDLLYHGGYDAWKEAIQTIKDKYPR